MAEKLCQLKKKGGSSGRTDVDITGAVLVNNIKFNTGSGQAFTGDLRFPINGVKTLQLSCSSNLSNYSTITFTTDNGISVSKSDETNVSGANYLIMHFQAFHTSATNQTFSVTVAKATY